MEKIFKELVVIELSSVLAGPAVGMFFAELGAKVIKIENKRTGGDVTRSWKLPQEDNNQPLSAYYHSINWGKETLLMDFKDEKDKGIVLDLIGQADIVISNFKAGSDKKLGLDYETLKTINPRLIYAAVNAYGEKNPLPGFDAMMQAETGWMSMNGEANGNPVKMPVALIDILTAHQLKEGVLIALLQREKTGKGAKVSASLFDSSLASLANQASNWLNVGALPKRKGSQHPNISPYGDVFYTKDGKPVLLGVGTQKQFEELCEILEEQKLISDPRFLNNQLRLQHRNALNEILEPAFGKINFEDLSKKCKKQKVTIAPINDLKDVFERSEAQDLILEEQHDDGTISKRVKTVVFKISD